MRRVITLRHESTGPYAQGHIQDDQLGEFEGACGIQIPESIRDAGINGGWDDPTHPYVNRMAVTCLKCLAWWHERIYPKGK